MWRKTPLVDMSFYALRKGFEMRVNERSPQGRRRAGIRRYFLSSSQTLPVITDARRTGIALPS